MPGVPIAKKSLGQHWLEDDASLEAMCSAVQVTSGDIVLEIGPGYGTLTEKLLLRGATVIALEFDEPLIKILEDKFRAYTNGKLAVKHGDIRTFDLTELPQGYKIVANIPYYLTSNLIQILSESSNPPDAAALLVQSEVAERVAAKPGDMSVLSVTAQYYWVVELSREVPAELFTPPPKVDSRILVLNRRMRPLFDGVDPKQFFRLVKAGFSQRRKTLINSLSGGLQISREQAAALLNRVGIDPGARAQTLAIEEWHKIYLAADNNT